MKYIAIYNETFKSLRRLGPQRAGQVLYAMMAYAETGALPVGLDEGQSIIMDNLMDKHDRDDAAYQARAARSRTNGTNGGRPKNPSGITAPSENPAGYQETQENPVGTTTPHHTDTDTDTTPTPTPTPTLQASSASVTPLMDAVQAAEISRMQDQCILAARNAGFPVDTVACSTAICDLAAEYGVELMLRALQACVDNGINKLAYLKKVLTNMRDNVPKPAVPQYGGRGPRILREQNYDQREYEPSTGIPDWMQQMLGEEKAAEEAARQAAQQQEQKQEDGS